MMTREDVQKYLTLLQSVINGLARISGSDKLKEFVSILNKFLLEDWFVQLVTTLFEMLSNKKELSHDDFKLLLDTVKIDS